jgi:hypothetical protein
VASIYLGAYVLERRSESRLRRTTEALLGSNKRSQEPRTRDLLFQIIFQPTSTSGAAYWSIVSYSFGQASTGRFFEISFLIASFQLPSIISELPVGIARLIRLLGLSFDYS